MDHKVSFKFILVGSVVQDPTRRQFRGNFVLYSYVLISCSLDLETYRRCTLVPKSSNVSIFSSAIYFLVVGESSDSSLQQTFDLRAWKLVLKSSELLG
ncbi:hypothetical protein M9H77_26818 [Catharanthus roseus]|uniref:Uncharacterized protein n=1 Tax=Catharanthus roseus TaxID=4058 RepID=A0ACC0ACM9_CATRO|nr:hypothetical protein M9H77_26818 [Catharanthus roseus]